MTAIYPLESFLSVDNAVKMQEDILKLFNKENKEIVLDASKLEKIDIIGMQLLVGIYIKARKNGITFKIINMNKELNSLFQLSGLIDVLEEVLIWH